ncbi:MAG: HD domain-containing protein [Acidobacteria bacterium]|nr:HD domain-containing protein [Acidobacteriota bacterium]
MSTAVIALPPGAGFTTEILEAYRPLFGQVVIFDEGTEPRQAGALPGLAQAEADELRAWMRMIPVALAAAADPRGPAHPSGPSRVVWTALQVLKRLDPDAAAHPITQFGLLLRDIGVLAGGLSEGTMEHHPVRGAEILSGIPPLVEAIPIVRHHHERFDGTGYPDRLVGRKIPSACRAVAVAEAFDARGASGGGLERAAADLRNDRGGAYDPEAVDILLDLVERDALGLNPSGNAVGDRPGAEEGGGV